MDYLELIKDKEKHASSLNVAPIILDYNAQYKKVENIIKQH